MGNSGNLVLFLRILGQNGVEKIEPEILIVDFYPDPPTFLFVKAYKILLKICQSFKFSYFVLVVFVNVQKNNLERTFSTKVTQVNVCLSSK